MKDRLFFLFVSLVVLVVLSPILRADILGKVIMQALAAVIVISAIYGIKPRRRTLILTTALGILSLIAGVAALLAANRVMAGVASFSQISFFGCVVGLLLRHIVKAKKVTANILYGSVSVYLLLGLVWGALYVFLMSLNPASFTLSGAEQGASGSIVGDLTYYSFVTLTTLGYGDIVPVSDYARTFSVLEAITGTLYVAILISRLVSMYIAQSLQRGDQ